MKVLTVLLLVFLASPVLAAEVDLAECLSGSGVLTDTPELACVDDQPPPPPITCEETLYESFDSFAGWVDWSEQRSAGGVQNGEYGQFSPSRWAFSWRQEQYPADGYVEATISIDRIDNMLHQIFIRRQSDWGRYGMHWYNGNWELKYDGVPSSQTDLVASAAAPQPAPGSVMRLEAIGNELVAYLDGVEIMSGTDTRITQGGQIGVIGINLSGTGGFQPVFSDFAFGGCN